MAQALWGVHSPTNSPKGLRHCANWAAIKLLTPDK